MTTTACSIIPPYVLEELARADDEHVAAQARRTLEVDAGIRNRLRARDAMPAPSEPAPQRTTRGASQEPDRTIYDAKQGTTLPGTQVRREGESATGDEAVDQAYDGLGATWTLLHDAFDRNSLDDRGLPLLASVHYSRDYDNAFWDGEQMVFGDGDGTIFLGFTRSIDVIGHELAHGMTQYTAGLNYQGQSGALNEHVSDVFGSLVKQQTLGQAADEADWLIGADLLAPGVKGKALRSMKEPGTAYDDPRLGKDPQPDHMDGYVETTSDNGGVHINSGIPNRAFAVAALELGGNAWDGLGQVWYDVLTGDIRADCDFATFAALTIKAAAEVDEATAAAVRKGWETVGVDPEQAAKPRKRRSRARKAAGDTAPPRKNAKVVVRRTGGVAGRQVEREVRLRDLSQEDAEHWQALVATRALERASLDTGSPRPDAFNYEVHVPSRGLDLSIPEPALDDRARELLDRTLRED
jgi:Zn-dependent metalloprotease